MNPADEHILAAFAERYWSDVEAGGSQELGAYLELFPGREELVAREWLALAGDEPETSDHPGVGPFRLISEIGRGGQAVVWLAQDTRLERRVALKVLKAGPGEVYGVIDRFRREAAIAASLDDPGICPVYEVGFDEVPWIAMRYIEGQSLAEKLRGARTPGSVAAPWTPSADADSDELVRIFAKLARSLHTAHESGIVHRDIKPGNIMLADGEPVILDFGVARIADGEAPTLTHSDQLIGTPIYMAPEQVRAAGSVDRRVDVYALGTTLYEVFSGVRPFERPTREATYRAILEEEAPPLTTTGARVRRDLETVIQTAMAKEAARRYASAAALADDLERVLRREPILARRITPLGRVRLWARRRPTAAILMLVLTLGLPLGGAAVAYILATRPAIERQDRLGLERRIEGELIFGLEELHHGDAEQGFARIEKAAAEAPADLDTARVVRAWAHASSGRFEEALGFLAGRSELARMRRVVLRLAKREDEAAQIQEDGETRPIDWFIRGVAALNKGHERGTLADFEASAVQMRMAIVHSERPRLLYCAEYAHALMHVQQKGGELMPDEVFGLAELLVERWPEFYLSWRRAAMLTRDFDPTISIAYANQAIAVAPADRKWELKDDLGVVLSTAKRFDEAESLYRSLLETASTAEERGKCNKRLGKIAFQLRRGEEAEGFITRSLEDRPGDADLWNLLGGIRNDLRRSKGAIAALRRAAEIDPNDINLGNLAVVLQAAGETTEAVLVARKAIEQPVVDLKKSPRVRSHCHEILMKSAALSRRFEEALQHFEKIFEGRPEAHDLWNRYAFLLVQMGKNLKARQAARRALDLVPDNADYRAMWGLSVLLTGESDRGYEIIGEAYDSGKVEEQLLRTVTVRATESALNAIAALDLAKRPQQIAPAIHSVVRRFKHPVFATMLYRQLVGRPELKAAADAGAKLCKVIPRLDPKSVRSLVRETARPLWEQGHHKVALDLLDAIIDRMGEAEGLDDQIDELEALYEEWEEASRRRR